MLICGVCAHTDDNIRCSASFPRNCGSSRVSFYRVDTDTHDFSFAVGSKVSLRGGGLGIVIKHLGWTALQIPPKKRRLRARWRGRHCKILYGHGKIVLRVGSGECAQGMFKGRLGQCGIEVVHSSQASRKPVPFSRKR